MQRNTGIYFSAKQLPLCLRQTGREHLVEIAVLHHPKEVFSETIQMLFLLFLEKSTCPLPCRWGAQAGVVHVCRAHWAHPAPLSP